MESLRELLDRLLPPGSPAGLAVFALLQRIGGLQALRHVTGRCLATSMGSGVMRGGRFLIKVLVGAVGLLFLFLAPVSEGGQA
jgi:hypothetical protein